MRTEPLPFALPDIGDAEIDEVAAAMRSGWITTGPRTREFETRFAQRVGARHAIAVSSCTAALHLALEAAGIGPGDRVITSPYTFCATAEIIRYFQAIPVFVDIEAETFNLDPARLAEKIEGAKAVVPVHVGGEPCRMDEILELARAHGAKVIEDAAHALPTRYRGRTVGGIADITCFSFYATKTLATGEGGMLCTNDDAVAERCRVMRLHGISRDAWKRHSSEGGSILYDVIAPGFKYNLSDVASAMGLVQLARLDEMWARRREIAARYDEAFGRIAALQVPHRDPANEHSWHLYMLRLHLDRLRIDRDGVVAELGRRKIGVSIHFAPLHMFTYYRETYGYRPEDFPVALGEFRREISLPIFSKMTDRDVDDVIEAVSAVVSEHGA
jgi:perosamine synthetase